MHRTAVACLSIAVLGSVSPAAAQNFTPAEEEAIKSALPIVAFDSLSAKCGASRGFSAAEAKRIAGWEAENAVPRKRTAAGALQKDARAGPLLARAAQMIVDQSAAAGMGPCESALALTGAPRAAQQDAQETSAAPVAAPKTGAGRSNSISGQIDSFGFDTRMAMGMGGFLTTDIYPVVLFRDGRALTDMAALGDPGGIAAHRQSNPGKWFSWRRAGGKIELNKKDGWKALSFPRTYTSLPAGFRLDGLYRRLSGTGNLAMGGSQSVSVVSDYRFWPDGRMVRGGAAGSTASSGDSSVVTSNTAPNARGRYRVTGLTLHIDYDDGSSEQRLIIADPKPPVKAIWLDGLGFVARGR